MIYTTCLQEIFHHRFPYFRFFIRVHRHLTLRKKNNASSALDAFTTSVFTSKLRSKTGRLTLTAHSKVLCETKDVTALWERWVFAPPRGRPCLKTCSKNKRWHQTTHVFKSVWIQNINFLKKCLRMFEIQSAFHLAFWMNHESKLGWMWSWMFYV